MPQITVKEFNELQKLRAYKAATEPVLQHIYDVLYFDSDKNCFDPSKEWDSAPDFLDIVASEMLSLYGRPKPRSRKYPDIKVKKS